MVFCYLCVKPLHLRWFFGFLMRFSLFMCKSFTRRLFSWLPDALSLVPVIKPVSVFRRRRSSRHRFTQMVWQCRRRPNAGFQRRRWPPPPTGTSDGAPRRQKVAPRSGAAPAASAAKHCWAVGLKKRYKYYITKWVLFYLLVHILHLGWFLGFLIGFSLSLCKTFTPTLVSWLPDGFFVIFV